ncbi:MAG: hotdog fold domain-containing protein [Steroidobacteraceae bacterium]
MADDSGAPAAQIDWLTTTSTTAVSPVLAQWKKRAGSRLGRWLFARAVCRKAPFFAAIQPRFIELAPAICRASIPKRRAVENHLGTVHALAMGTLCELVAGMVTEVTIPDSMRWIPRGMTIEYLRKADSDVTATARLDKNEWREAGNVGVPVTVVDARGEEVVRAVITMYVSPRNASETRKGRARTGNAAASRPADPKRDAA